MSEAAGLPAVRAAGRQKTEMEGGRAAGRGGKERKTPEFLRRPIERPSKHHRSPIVISPLPQASSTLVAGWVLSPRGPYGLLYFVRASRYPCYQCTVRTRKRPKRLSTSTLPPM